MKYLLWSFFLSLMLCEAAASASPENPLVYPDRAVVSSTAPFFCWKDLSGSDLSKTTFRVSLDSGKGYFPFFEGSPMNHNGFFYLMSPKPLSPGIYSYTLSPLYDGKPDTTRYFGYRRYPVKGQFTASASGPATDPTAVIDYMAASENNMQDNGYNAFFYGGGALVCGGIAALFFGVFDFNIWTKIIGGAFAAGAVTGICASSWYGYHYVSEKHMLDNRYRSLRERGIELSFSAKM